MNATMTPTGTTPAPATVGGAYWVPEENLGRLTERLAKIGKRAAKLGLGAVEFSVLETEDRPYKSDGQTAFRRYSLVRVAGPRPRLAGWEFCATLEHLATEDGAAVNMLRAVPGLGVDLPAAYRTAANWCDHCKTARPRISTYVVHHDDGRWAQVGSTCLADFVGGADPQAVAELAEMLIDACGDAEDATEDGWGGCGSGPRRFRAEDFLAFTSEAITRWGWMSRREAEIKMSTPTSIIAIMGMFPEKTTPAEKRWTPTDAAKIEAREALAWAACEFADGNPGRTKPLSDYEWNLRVAIGREVIDDRLTGIVASLIPCYRRAVAREIERVRAAAESKHVGTIGKREVFMLTATRFHEIDGQYGTTTIVSFLDADGNRLKWFASGAEVEKLDVGGTYEVKATVKKHDEYHGVRETCLSRCKVVKVVTPGHE